MFLLIFNNSQSSARENRFEEQGRMNQLAGVQRMPRAFKQVFSLVRRETEQNRVGWE